MRRLTALVLLTIVAGGCGKPAPPQLGGFTIETAQSSSSVTGTPGHWVIAAHASCIDDVVFAPSGQEVATCGLDETLRIWNVKTGEYVRGFVGPNRVLAVAYSPDGSQLAASTLDNGLYTWNTITWESAVVAQTKGQPGTIAYSPSGEYIAASTAPIELWRMRDWRLLRQRHGHSEGGGELAFSPDSTQLVSSNADGFAKLWRVPQLREQHRLQHGGGVQGVAFAPDGKDGSPAAFAAPAVSTRWRSIASMWRQGNCCTPCAGRPTAERSPATRIWRFHLTVSGS